MSQPPKIITDLVEKFDQHVDSCRGSAYNETMVRQEFIDPMFEALGWDMYNKSGYSQAFRDVIHEDAIKVGGATKAPDYCFRIGGTRKFFLETKKPAVDIKGAIHPAYQLRRYAWSAKLPLSISPISRSSPFTIVAPAPCPPTSPAPAARFTSTAMNISNAGAR